MADAKLDMALDDLVSQDRPRRGRGGRGGNRGGGAMRRGRATRNETPYARGNINAQWQHDLHDAPARAAAAPAVKGGTKIIVSNLNPNIVKDLDMKELFSRVGRLKYARCHYDSRGRNLGTAEVEFYKAEDAMQAKREYDGVALDGRTMKIELVVDAVAQRVGVVDRLAPSGQRTRAPIRMGGETAQRGEGGAQRGTRGRGRGGRGRGRGRAPRPTGEDAEKLANELDAELDAYMDTEQE